MADRGQPPFLEWEIRAPVTGVAPARDPRKAYFRWKDGESVIKTQDFTEEELAAQVRELEEASEQVPSAYYEALGGFLEGG
jgi:hypothetical protein